jgi:hypothetical protein
MFTFSQKNQMENYEKEYGIFKTIFLNEFLIN